MATLFVVLHVLAAIFVVGPLCVAPLTGLRGISRREPDRIATAVRQTLVFGAASVVVAALGVAALAAGHEYSYTAPWVTISATLYVVALAITFAGAVPALRRAGHLIAAGVPEVGGGRHAAVAGTDRAAKPDHADTGVATTAEDVLSQSKLDNARGRVVVSTAAMLVIFAAITVLMVTRPFGG